MTAREIPGRLLGALRGDPVTFRRILGARRGGRVGLALFGLGVLAAFPLGWALPGGALQIATVAALRAWPRGGPDLTLRERLRLSLWTTGPVLLVCGLPAALWPGSVLPGLSGLAIGQAILIRGLTTGLRAPTP